MRLSGAGERPVLPVGASQSPLAGGLGPGEPLPWAGSAGAQGQHSLGTACVTPERHGLDQRARVLLQ